METLIYKNYSTWNLFVSVSTVWQTTVVLVAWKWALFGFPSFAVLEEVVWWIVTKKEIVKVTNISADTLTITRAQWGTSADTFSIANWARLSQYPVAEDFEELQTGILEKANIASPSFTGIVTTAGNVELWHASDTTLSRVSPWLIAVEWVTVWFIELKRNSRSADYTTTLADSWGGIYHPSADTTARTRTIPANASVAYPVGTAITFINDTSGGVITIAITTDVMVLGWPGTTGSRTLAASWMATAVKMTTTRRMITGTGLT